MSDRGRIVELILRLDEEERKLLWRDLVRHGIHVSEADPSSGLAYQMSKVAGASDHARVVASQDPFWAYSYAKDIDNGPHDVTREGASVDPERAFNYAQVIDRKKPHDVTRKGCCQHPQWALRYALMIDETYHPETWAAVQDDAEQLDMYQSFVRRLPDECQKR